MFSKIIIAGLACTVSFAAAWTKPTGESPSGNDLYTPGKNDIVPVGEPYQITWKPTTEGTVTLLLLKGPSSNAVAQYAIVEHIANTGSYTWTPKTDLVAQQTGYGIELIDDTTGAYQYTTQFGISNDHQSAGSNTTISTSTGTSSPAETTSEPIETATETGSSSIPTDVTGPYTNGTAETTTTSAPVTVITSKPTSGGNATVPTGIKTTTVSSSKTSSTIAPAGTGAAATMAGSFAGLVLAAGIAVFAA